MRSSWTTNLFLVVGATQAFTSQSLSFNHQKWTEAAKVRRESSNHPFGNFGDIMSQDEDAQIDSIEPSKSGLVTLDGGTLASKFGVTSRLDRMALTANGNLQRLFSSFYDAPVRVVVDRCEQTSDELWDRVVHLMVHDQVSTQNIER